MIDESKLIKCGFNSYYDILSGFLYEKKAGDLIKVNSGARGEVERSFVIEKLSAADKDDGLINK